jgi:hypothetical protein
MTDTVLCARYPVAAGLLGVAPADHPGGMSGEFRKELPSGNPDGTASTSWIFASRFNINDCGIIPYTAAQPPSIVSERLQVCRSRRVSVVFLVLSMFQSEAMNNDVHATFS